MDSFVRWMPYVTYYRRSCAHKKNVESSRTCVIYFDASFDICHAQTDRQCWSSLVCLDKRHESISKLLSNILISLSSLFLPALSPFAVLPYFNELLSAEILVHIFSYLREGDLVQISMVCRKFHQIASMESLWWAKDAQSVIHASMFICVGWAEEGHFLTFFASLSLSQAWLVPSGVWNGARLLPSFFSALLHISQAAGSVAMETTVFDHGEGICGLYDWGDFVSKQCVLRCPAIPRSSGVSDCVASW